MTVTLQTLLDQVTETLKATATDIGDRWYRTGDWPTQADQYPIGKIRGVSESKQSLGRGDVEFTVLGTIEITLETSAPAEVAGAGAAVAEAQLYTLQRQVEVAAIGLAAIVANVQQLASVQAQFLYTSDAQTHLAGLGMRLVYEYYQGPWDFAPVEADDLNEVDATLATTAASAITIPTA